MLTTIDPAAGTLLCYADLKDEPHAVCCNPKSSAVFIGYASGDVMGYQNEKLESQTALTRFKMPVRGVALSDSGAALMAVSEDSTANLVMLEPIPQVIECAPGHEGSIKACAIHPNATYAATTGCDGYINVYQIPRGTESASSQVKVERVRREKITENKSAMVLSSPLKLQPTWSKDGKYLLVPGDFVLRYMETEQWVLKLIPEIVHKSEISLIEPLTDDLVAVCGADSTVYFWQLSRKTCLATLDIQGTVLEAHFEPEKRYFAVLSSSAVGAVTIPEEMFAKPAADPHDVEMKNAETVAGNATGTAEATKMELEPAKEEAQPQEKKKPPMSKLAAILDAVPQEHFQVNATQYDDSLRFLCWNSVGSVTLLNSASSVSISFDFADKTSQRNFLLPDEYGISLAAMCPSGAIMASQIDLEKPETSASTIQFVPFHEWRGIKGWTYELPKGESAEVVAVGSRWAAVYTSQYLIRVFSHEGLQRHVFCMETPVVTMAGYENVLGIVYHHSVPILGNQRMNLRVLDMKNSFECLIDVPLALSTDMMLKWIGFSDEGQIFAYDTAGIVRALLPYAGNSWVPVMDVQAEGSTKDIWIVSISKTGITGVELHGAYAEPKLSDKTRLKEYKFKLPLLKTEGADAEFEENYMITSFGIKQAQYRKQMWGRLKQSRKQQDPEFVQSATIATDEELMKAQKDIDVMLLDKIRQCCINNENEKAVSYAEMMHLTLSLSLAVKLCQKLHKNDIADKISVVLEV